MVRRAIAINLGDFAKVIGHPIDVVLKSYKTLLTDQQDAVRIEALKNSCILAQILKDNGEELKLEEDIVMAIKTASEDKKSWRLRFSVAELLADFTHIIEKDLAEKHIKEIIEHLLVDGEPEVRSEIIIKVTEIVEFVKPDLVLDKLIALTSDASQHVRESLAE